MNAICKFGFQTTRNVIIEIIKRYDLILTNTGLINDRRYQILTFKDKLGNKIKHALLFKKENFHSYGVICNDVGQGETMNVDDYENTLIESENIYFYYQRSNNITELKFISILDFEKAKANGKVTRYLNKADNKWQYLFSERILKDFN